MKIKTFICIIGISFFATLWGSPEKPAMAEVNFDQLEFEALESDILQNATFTKPHPLMILLRRIGLPIINAYFIVHSKMSSFFSTLLISWNKVISHGDTAR